MPKFNPEKVFEFTKLLSFPRLVGSAGERDAALMITQAFKDLGLEVIEESFDIPIFPWTLTRIVLTIGLLLLIVTRLIGERFPLVAVLILIAILVVTMLVGKIWQNVVRSKVNSKRNDRLESTNIIARFPDTNNHGNMPTLYLSSHYDTKSQSISLPVRILLVLIFSLSLILLMFGFLLQMFGSVEPGQGESEIRAIIDLSFLFASLSALLLLFVKTHNKSPGALDNAAGVGLLLGIAEALRDALPKNLNLGFIVFGAEEQGLVGSNKFVVRHRDELDKKRFLLLNFDGIGIVQKLRVCHGVGFSMAFPQGRLANAVKKAVDQTRTKLGILPMYPGLLMDHVPFAAKGLETLSLACLASESSKIHTRKDTMELVEVEGLEEIGKVTLKMIEILDESFVKH